MILISIAIQGSSSRLLHHMWQRRHSQVFELLFLPFSSFLLNLSLTSPFKSLPSSSYYSPAPHHHSNLIIQIIQNLEHGHDDACEHVVPKEHLL